MQKNSKITAFKNLFIYFFYSQVSQAVLQLLFWKGGQMCILLIICRELEDSWVVFTQKGCASRGGRVILSGFAHPGQCLPKLRKPHCCRSQGRGIGQDTMLKKQPNIWDAAFFMDFRETLPAALLLHWLKPFNDYDPIMSGSRMP